MIDEFVHAIRTGDQVKLNSLLAVKPDLAHIRVDGQRTALHTATDWPGHFPHVKETISTLIANGADVNARVIGLPHRETPLHWAASSDDVEALDTLIDHGADMDADGGIIGEGTPLADAVAFATWNAARRLVARGARSTIWQAAALDLMDRLKSFPEADSREITNAFWAACHGGQLEAAKYLLTQGADPNWIGHDRLTPLAAAQRNGNPEVLAWLKSHLVAIGPSRS